MPPPLNQFWKEKFKEIYGAVPPSHKKLKWIIFFLVLIFEKKKWRKFLVPSPIDKITSLKLFEHKNEKRIIFFFLLISWKEKFEGILVPPPPP